MGTATGPRTWDQCSADAPKEGRRTEGSPAFARDTERPLDEEHEEAQEDWRASSPRDRGRRERRERFDLRGRRRKLRDRLPPTDVLGDCDAHQILGRLEL